VFSVALLFAFASPQAVLPAPAGRATAHWIGGLRHVQLLEVTDEAITFATAHKSSKPTGGILALYRMPVAAEARGAMHALGAPFRHIVLSDSQLPVATYERPPLWRVLRDARGWFAIVHEMTPKRIALVRFEDGTRIEFDAANLELLDARVDGDRVHVLVRTEWGIALHELDGELVTTRSIVTGAPFGSAAAFVAGSRSEVAVARWLDHGLQVDHVELGALTVDSTIAEGVLRADGGVSGLRLRSWTDGKTRYDLVGDSDYKDRNGRVVCFSSTDDPETSQQVWTSEDFLPRFGHSIALVQDLDGDHVPDVAVGSPGAMWGSAAVHSMRTGQVIDRLPLGDAWIRWGSDISATTDGRYFMVAGGTQAVPELLHAPAAAQVFEAIVGDLPRAAVVQGWSWVAPTTAIHH
jgi:hypothetical protein